jgi:proline iminopeptidase
MAALVYTLRYPEAVLALLVADSAPSWRFYEDADSIYNPLHPDAWREEEARLALDGSDSATRRWVRTLLSLGLRNRTPLEELVQTTRIVPERLRATREEVLADPQWDVEDDLDSIRCQTLIICGRHDRLFPLRWSELMHERIPNSQLVVFEHSNHFPAEEEPERFQATVAAFLDRVRAPAEAARA